MLFRSWLQNRFYWVDFTAELRQAMLRAEAGVKKKLAAQNPAVETGIWVEQMIAVPLPGTDPAGNGPIPVPRLPSGGEMPPEFAPMNPNGRARGSSGVAENTVAETNVITLVCRAVNLTSVDPSANSTIAYTVENEIKASPMVNPKTTQLVGQITLDDANGTFTFIVNVTPLKSMKF